MVAISRLSFFPLFYHENEMAQDLSYEHTVSSDLGQINRKYSVSKKIPP